MITNVLPPFYGSQYMSGGLTSIESINKVMTLIFTVQLNVSTLGQITYGHTVTTVSYVKFNAAVSHNVWHHITLHTALLLGRPTYVGRLLINCTLFISFYQYTAFSNRAEDGHQTLRRFGRR